jgi:hypothetical protein
VSEKKNLVVPVALHTQINVMASMTAGQNIQEVTERLLLKGIRKEKQEEKEFLQMKQSLRGVK